MTLDTFVAGAAATTTFGTDFFMGDTTADATDLLAFFAGAATVFAAFVPALATTTGLAAETGCATAALTPDPAFFGAGVGDALRAVAMFAPH